MSELRRITERYRLEKQVATSEAGSVFRAVDLQSGETVAVKLIHSDGESGEQRERFLETVHVLQLLGHPCLPRLVDFGFTTAGSAFLVTEYLEGSSFEGVAGSSPVRVLSLLLLLVDGLEALAGQGIFLRNLRADNILVVSGQEGEQVKILGLGSSSLEPGALPVVDGYAEDFHAFGLLACRVLRVETGSQIGIPLEIAVELEESEALRALLDAAQRGDPGGHYASYPQVRRALRSALFGQTGRKAKPSAEPFGTHPGPVTDSGAPAPAVRSARPSDEGTVLLDRSQLDLEPPPAAEPEPATPRVHRLPETVRIPAIRVAPPPAPLPSPPPVLATSAPAPPEAIVPEPPPVAGPGGAVPAAIPKAAPEIVEERATPPPDLRVVPPVAAPVERGQRSLLLKIGVPAAAVLVVVIALALSLLTRRKPEPPLRPGPVATLKPVTPPPAPAPAPAPPSPVHPGITLAEAALEGGDLKAVKAALDAITPEEQAVFRPDERERYQRLLDALAPLKREELAGQLARGLEKGDLRLLRTVADAVPPADEATLPPDFQKDLTRVRNALELDSRLSRAQRSGNPLEVIRQATALLQALPRAGRAAEQKERAARSIETAADSEIEAGQFDTALNRLNGLRQVWPERSGLASRLDRVAAERKTDQDLEALLAAVSRVERTRPQEGLQMLAGARPNHRYAARFQEARQRLETQLAELDRKAPEVRPGTNGDPMYEKGKTGLVPLRITDDLGVRIVEGWARPEGGSYARVVVRHGSGSDYVLEVPPEVHQNKNVEYYVSATDASGHTGQYGSAESPRRMKRKNWLEKILGKKEG